MTKTRKTTKTPADGLTRAQRYIEKGHQEATVDFMAAIERIHHTLAQLQNQVDDHLGVDPDTIHFGHVGDAKRILEGLREVLAIARHENR